MRTVLFADPIARHACIGASFTLAFLCRAIQASLRLALGDRTSPDGSTDTSPDEDLLQAILVSKTQQQEEERRRLEEDERRQQEEEALLEKILQLSLTEK